MKGYKAFKKGMICSPEGNTKQYKENTVYEEPTAKICKSGMHFCENPLDVLNYYPLVDDNGDLTEFAEVEAIDKVYTDDDKKFCTKKLKVGAKLSFKAFVEAAISFVFEKVIVDKKDGSQLTSSGFNSQLASSGDGSQLASSGFNSQLASSGDGSKLASSGRYSKLASSGFNSQLASSGDGSKLASSGDGSQLASSGDGSQLASSGFNSKLASSGFNSQLASSGDGSKLASSGDGSQLASSGFNSQLASSGENSIIAGIGINNKVKGIKGNWITLAEWKYNKGKQRYIPICVKTEQIDGKRIKEDTFYTLKNGEFVEVDEDE